MKSILMTMKTKILQGLFESFSINDKSRMITFSTVQSTRRSDEPINDNDDEEEEMDDRPFTLNNGEELSDDEQLDDNEHESVRNQHIHENYKVDNERGR